ncbi:MAG: right-handed parallel beta-helix repeat-containing protein [Thiobacillus sp.]|nr:right-handed parallel beta-helix repeat-containing protein [Thiobacillus sp.]
MRGVKLFAHALCLLPCAVWSADYRATAADYREILRHLKPGDRLLLAAGDYRHGLPLHRLAGTASKPITIEAADPLTPPRFVAQPRSNTVSLVDVRHLVLRDLELDGANIPVDALKAEGHSRFADFITIERLHIHDYAASQQNVAISTKCPAFGWVIRDTVITHVGTGMYLGDSDGGDPFVAGLIEGNHVSQTRGYTLQIKHQISRALGNIARHDTVIRHNVFSKRGSAPGPEARPNLLLGHFPLSGPGAADRYLVYGNLFLDNASEALVQAEGRMAFYDNVLINAAGDALHIQPHNDVPREMDIFSNTVLASGTGIRIRRGDGLRYRQRVFANLVAAASPLEGGEASGNLTLNYDPRWLTARIDKLAPRMLAAKPTPPGLAKHETRRLAGYPDWTRRTHPGARIGPALLDAMRRGRP